MSDLKPETNPMSNETEDTYADAMLSDKTQAALDQAPFNDLLLALIAEIRELRARVFGADRTSTPTLDECVVNAGLEQTVDDEKALGGVRQTRIVKEVE